MNRTTNAKPVFVDFEYIIDLDGFHDADPS